MLSALDNQIRLNLLDGAADSRNFRHANRNWVSPCGKHTLQQPPAEKFHIRCTFLLPINEAPDLFPVGSAPGLGFSEVLMYHAEPGCGTLVELFGNKRTMILGQGDFDQVRHNLFAPVVTTVIAATTRGCITVDNMKELVL